MFKITVISFGPIESKSNGYFIRVWNILKELAKQHDLNIVVLEFPEYKTEEKIKMNNNITFIRLRGNELPNNKISFLLKNVLTFDPFHMIKFQLISFLELIKYKNQIENSDVIILEGCLLISAFIISKLLKKKVILDIHCVNKLLSRRIKNTFLRLIRSILWDFIERITMRLSDLIIVVSEKEQNYIVKEYGIDPRRIIIIPNIIEIPNIEKNLSKKVIEIRKDLGLEDKIVIIFVGNLESIQNADAVEYILNELAPWLLLKETNAIILIVGKGEKRFRHHLPSNVRFLGYVEELTPYLLASDICMIPLRIGAGTKTKFLECLAHGKPIITTPVGIEGIDEYIKSNEINNLVVVVSIDEFKDTLLDMIKKVKKRNTIENINSLSYLERLKEEFNNSMKKLLNWIHQFNKNNQMSS